MNDEQGCFVTAGAIAIMGILFAALVAVTIGIFVMARADGEIERRLESVEYTSRQAMSYGIADWTEKSHAHASIEGHIGHVRRDIFGLYEDIAELRSDMESGDALTHEALARLLHVLDGHIDAEIDAALDDACFRLRPHGRIQIVDCEPVE